MRCVFSSTARPVSAKQARGSALKALAASQQAAAAVSQQHAGSNRRQALLYGSGALMSLLASHPALALCVDQETEEAGDECRRLQLSLDADKQQKYGSVSTAGRPAVTAQGVPVSVLDDEYSRATFALSEKIQDYFTMDVYNKQRVPLIKSLKADSLTWVSKYARGGSVRKQSARKMYIAVDAIQGHLSSAGLAPFPAAKAKVVTANVDAAKAFIAEGK